MIRKKNSRLRGTHTHGWGAKKKHRGAGSRGGRGNAGSGKRGDCKKPSYWGDTRFAGKHGFKRPAKKVRKIQSINLKIMERNLRWFNAVEKNGVFEVDLSKAGIRKLLGTGKVTKKYNIKVEYASKSAIEKVTKAGGNVTVKPKQEKKKQEPKKDKPKKEAKPEKTENAEAEPKQANKAEAPKQEGN